MSDTAEQKQPIIHILAEKLRNKEPLTNEEAQIREDIKTIVSPLLHIHIQKVIEKVEYAVSVSSPAPVEGLLPAIQKSCLEVVELMRGEIVRMISSGSLLDKTNPPDLETSQK